MSKFITKTFYDYLKKKKDTYIQQAILNKELIVRIRRKNKILLFSPWDQCNSYTRLLQLIHKINNNYNNNDNISHIIKFQKIKFLNFKIKKEENKLSKHYSTSWKKVYSSLSNCINFGKLMLNSAWQIEQIFIKTK